MKILWIVNTPIDILGEKLYGKRVGGLWMDALLSDYRKHGGFELSVATVAKVKTIDVIVFSELNVMVLPVVLPEAA